MKELSRIERMKKQREELEARIRKAESLARHQERKDDTRRKILIGSYYLDQTVKQNTMTELVKAIDPFLIRAKDRELFGLQPLPD